MYNNYNSSLHKCQGLLERQCRFWKSKKRKTKKEEKIMDLKNIFHLIDERKEELFDLLSSFIKIPSESSGKAGGKEAELAKTIYSYCKDIGLEAELYSPVDIPNFCEHPEHIPGYNLDNRYNVTARLRGKENNDTLMLMGHSDTVSVGDVSNWSFDPFCGEIRDGKILGRGTCDDKYALALSLFLMKLFKEAGFVPRSNILFTAYCDEEYGGSHGALAAVLKYPCAHILNIDGMDGEIWHCGTGGQDVEYTFSAEDSVESAELCGRAISTVLDVLEAFKDKRKKELNENRFYNGTAVAALPMRYREIRVGDNGNDLGVGKIAFEYYTDKTEKEIREELDGMEKLLKEKLAPLGIKSGGFHPLCRFFHYIHCEPDSKIVTDLCSAYKSVTGKEPKVCAACLSDASVISKYGSESLVTFGIAKGFSEKGGPHQNNEFVDCDKLVEITKIVASYILNTLGEF